MIRLRVAGLLLVLGVAVASWALTCAAWRFDRVAAGVRPLEPRRFAVLTVVAAGTGGARENPARRGPVTAVGAGSDVVLVDAGRAAADALRGATIPPSQPDTVLLTSLLPENTVGLDDLRYAAWLAGRDRGVRLVGPPGTAALAAALEAGHRRGTAARGGGWGGAAAPGFDAIEIADGWSARMGELAVRAGALPGGPLEAFAYSFEWRGRSAVVAGAGWAPDALVEFARGANLLVHEAVSIPAPEIAAELGLDAAQLAREAALHTRLEAVGALARRARVDALALVRLRPPPVYGFQVTSLVDDDYAGRILVPDDGDELIP